jgi:hypothetical protein
MLASEVITVSIRRPFAEVYEFVADPMNMTRWASIPDTGMESLGGNDWMVELPSGRTVIRFSPRNPFGVLDYQIFQPGEEPTFTIPVRLIRNREGTDFQLVVFRREGMTDAEFRSEIEWTESDLQRLKTLLEGG